MKVRSGKEFHTFVSISIAVKIETLGISFFLFKAAICFFTATERYLALRDRIGNRGVIWKRKETLNPVNILHAWVGRVIYNQANFRFQDTKLLVNFFDLILE